MATRLKKGMTVWYSDMDGFGGYYFYCGEICGSTRHFLHIHRQGRELSIPRSQCALDRDACILLKIQEFEEMAEKHFAEDFKNEIKKLRGMLSPEALKASEDAPTPTVDMSHNLETEEGQRRFAEYCSANRDSINKRFGL